MFNFHLIILLCAAFFGHNAFALGSGAVIPPEQAFKISAKAVSAGELLISFDIADGVYIYRDKIKIETAGSDVEISQPVLPDGEKKHDPLFGDVIIYRSKVDVPVALRHLKQATGMMDVAVRFHGCSDAGICYPPQKAALHVDLPEVVAGSDAFGRLASGLQGLKQGMLGDELLPAEDAFRFFAEIKDANTLHVNWQIADGYYLYRDKIQLALLRADSVSLGDYTLPGGEAKDDPEFGKVEVYHREIGFDVPLRRVAGAAQLLVVQAKYQGCEERRGVCYLPMQQQVELQLPETAQAAPALAEPQAVSRSPALSEQDRIVQALHHDSLALTLLSFLGFGLLLAFTPCVFPMVPILSGLIVGKGRNITTRRAFLLSLSYVLASALTYTAFGIIAALFGSNLQAAFQNPWIIGTFSAVFIVLALSMFGFYHLEMPKSIQSYLHNSSDKHRDGTLLGAGLMGAFSALIVGPCVAAPLAAALIYIGQTGDAVLGGAALFTMGLGMGMPLLLVGASAGKLLPKAGHWLSAINAVFGVIMLAVAVWMLQRILPPAVAMLLWALLLIIPSIYLGALEPLPLPASGWRKFWKGSGLALLVYGVLLLVGVGMGNGNPLKPLQGLMLNVAAAGSVGEAPHRQKVPFERITSLDDLQTKLQQAGAKNQWVMLDFYADWCVSCQEMEAYTFTDPQVIASLEHFVVLQADVTENTEADNALLKRFNLVGPPATLFFAPDGQERAEYRVIGFQDAEMFIAHLPKPD